jgi:hypothetical protein
MNSRKKAQKTQKERRKKLTQRRKGAKVKTDRTADERRFAQIEGGQK